jgi:hypothetical protein
MMRQFAASAGRSICVQGTERHWAAGCGSRSHDQKDHRGRPKRRAQRDTVAGCRADWPKKAKKRSSWIKGEAVSHAFTRSCGESVVSPTGYLPRACSALCRAHAAEELQKRRGTRIAEHLKQVLRVTTQQVH